MRIKPMQQFLDSATHYLSPSEVATLAHRLRADPTCGELVPKAGPLRQLPHPGSIQKSDYGHYPVVVYIVARQSNEIILVDVLNDQNAILTAMKTPTTWLRILILVRAIKYALEQVL